MTKFAPPDDDEPDEDEGDDAEDRQPATTGVDEEPLQLLFAVLIGAMGAQKLWSLRGK